MVSLMLGLTIGLLVVWGIAFLERIDALINVSRDSSVWSLLLVGTMVLVHLALLYVEGAVTR